MQIHLQAPVFQENVFYLLYGAEKFNKLNKTNVNKFVLPYLVFMKQMVIFAFIIFNTQSDHCLENNTHNVTEAYK